MTYTHRLTYNEGTLSEKKSVYVARKSISLEHLRIKNLRENL